MEKWKGQRKKIQNLGRVKKARRIKERWGLRENNANEYTCKKRKERYELNAKKKKRKIIKKVVSKQV